MTHQMLLALFVLSGVFTEQELEQFLLEKDGETVPNDANWKFYMDEINEWKEANHQKIR